MRRAVIEWEGLGHTSGRFVKKTLLVRPWSCKMLCPYSQRKSGESAFSINRNWPHVSLVKCCFFFKIFKKMFQQVAQLCGLNHQTGVSSLHLHVSCQYFQSYRNCHFTDVKFRREMFVCYHLSFQVCGVTARCVFVWGVTADCYWFFIEIFPGLCCFCNDVGVNLFSTDRSAVMAANYTFKVATFRRIF